MATSKKPATKAKARKPKGVKIKDAATHVNMTLEVPGAPTNSAKKNLPKGMVSVKGNSGLVINVEKLSKSLIRDQRARLVSSMGCISNPGGPGC